jgi:hypothetical protein
MRTQTELDYLSESESHAPLYFGVQIDRSLFVTLRPSASDDAKRADQASPENDVESRARHAAAANGFGDTGANFAVPKSFELHKAVRAHRARMPGSAILGARRVEGAKK